MRGRLAACGALVVLAVVALCLGGRTAGAAEAPPDGDIFLRSAAAGSPDARDD